MENNQRDYLFLFKVTEEEIWGDDLSKSDAKPALFKGTVLLICGWCRSKLKEVFFGGVR